MPKLSILLSSLFVSWIVKTLSYPNITCGKHFLFANMETCLKLERKIDIWIDGQIYAVQWRKYVYESRNSDILTNFTSKSKLF